MFLTWLRGLFSYGVRWDHNGGYINTSEVPLFVFFLHHLSTSLTGFIKINFPIGDWYQHQLHSYTFYPQLHHYLTMSDANETRIGELQDIVSGDTNATFSSIHANETLDLRSMRPSRATRRIDDDPKPKIGSTTCFKTSITPGRPIIPTPLCTLAGLY